MVQQKIGIRNVKFLDNRLLERKQMVIRVIHPNSGTVKRTEIRERLAEVYKVPADVISVFGVRTKFGGGESKAFALIYDNVESYQKTEPKYRKERFMPKPEGEIVKISSKQRKERKNKAKKYRGTKPPSKRSKK